MMPPVTEFDRLPTPALVVDLPTVERNVARLATYARQHKIGVRPHTKTHKSLRMAKLQIDHGAIGLTAAKAGEAIEMAKVSQDLLVAYPAIDPHRGKALAELEKIASVAVALDGLAGAQSLSDAIQSTGATIRVLVDLDIGFHRTGVQSPAASLELAQQISKLPGLKIAGIFFYPGHVWSPADQQSEELARIDAQLAEAIDLWKQSGLDTSIVSGGSTPTAYQSHLVTNQTEIRPGTYPYNDMNTARAGFCSLDDCAARIVVTVVSDAVPGKIIVDGGTKTFTSDKNATKPDSGHGHIVEYPDAALVRLSEEHGEVDVSKSARKPKVGERVSIIPNHICPCVNLRDEVWVRYATGELEPMRIDTRGKLS